MLSTAWPWGCHWAWPWLGSGKAGVEFGDLHAKKCCSEESVDSLVSSPVLKGANVTQLPKALYAELKHGKLISEDAYEAWVPLAWPLKSRLCLANCLWKSLEKDETIDEHVCICLRFQLLETVVEVFTRHRNSEEQFIFRVDEFLATRKPCSQSQMPIPPQKFQRFLVDKHPNSSPGWDFWCLIYSPVASASNVSPASGRLPGGWGKTFSGTAIPACYAALARRQECNVGSWWSCVCWPPQTTTIA